MANTASNFAGAMMSAAALAALALVPGGISIYMFAVMFQGHVATASMVLLAACLGIIGLGLAIACLYTLWWAFTKSAKKERSDADDEGWRDMPYPKG
jgi:hypothetical protein